MDLYSCQMSSPFPTMIGYSFCLTVPIKYVAPDLFGTIPARTCRSMYYHTIIRDNYRNGYNIPVNMEW